MSSNARNLSKLLGTSTKVPVTALPTTIENLSNKADSSGVLTVTALPPAIADLETVGQTLSGGEISPSSIKSNTFTQSFDSNQAVTFNMADSIDAVSPIVSVFKEVPQQGFSSKGQWDVNANATNYEFFDEKPISYASTTLTPSATGDGTFNSSSSIVTGYNFTNFAYDSVTAATGISGNNEAIRFNNNGTKMYILSDGGPDGIYQFSLSTAYDITTASYDSVSFSVTQDSSPRDFQFNSDGSKMFILGSTNRQIYRYSLSTAYDLSTTSYDSVSLSIAYSTSMLHFHFNGDGTKIYVGSSATWTIYERQLPGAYDISSESAVSTFGYNADLPSGSTEAYAYSGIFNDNGKKMYLLIGRMPDTSEAVIEYDLSTAYDLSTISRTSIQTLNPSNAGNDPRGMAWNSDGTKLIILTEPDDMFRFTSSTSSAFGAADVGKKVVGNSGSAIITATSGTYTSVTPFADTSAISSWQLFGAEGKADGSGVKLSGFSSSYGTIYGKSLSDVVNHTTDAFNSISTLIDFVISPDGTKLFYTQYNDGKIYERAISTAWDLSTISLTDTISGGHYLSNAPSTYISGFTWSTDGMKLYVVYPNSSTMAEFYNDPNYPQYAFRVDTLTYAGSNKTLNTNLSSGNTGIIFKNDGTMVFISNGSTPSVYSWPLSTAWDLSTAGTRVQSNINFSSNYLQCLAMSADGTSMIVENESNDNLQHFTLSTPFDITTMTETSQTHHINTVISGTTGAPYNIDADNPNSIQWADNGNRFFVYTTSNGASLTSTNQKAIYQFSTGSATHPYSQYSPALTNSSTGQINSSSWVDINSMTADETKNGGDIFYAVSTDNRTSWEVAKASDGVRKIVKNNSGTWQYNNHAGSQYDTSETWVDGTNNNEHATLQQALTSQAFNRMNKAQLDAVADAYHFSQDSADTLDLMIAPYTASGSSPISDGVTINYDTEAIVREAVNGTDYIAEFPQNDKVKIKSLINGNLKIRII